MLLLLWLVKMYDVKKSSISTEPSGCADHTCSEDAGGKKCTELPAGLLACWQTSWIRLKRMAPESSWAYNTHTQTHTHSKDKHKGKHMNPNISDDLLFRHSLSALFYPLSLQLWESPGSGQTHKHSTHTHMCTAPGEIPCSWVLCVSLWPLAWSIRWGKSVWGVGLNVKGKRCWKEKWKHAIDPLTLAELRVEEGEPQLCLPNTRQTKISHLHFFPQDWCCLYTQPTVKRQMERTKQKLLHTVNGKLNKITHLLFIV